MIDQTKGRVFRTSALLGDKLDELLWLADGREVELHFSPARSLDIGKATVYVRGDARDNFACSVARGGAPDMATAIAQACDEMAERKGKVSYAYLLLGRKGLRRRVTPNASGEPTPPTKTHKQE